MSTPRAEPPAESAQSPTESANPVSHTSAALKLSSLAPRYDETHHRMYLDALTYALRDDGGNRNIALTGAYGTGKSSVLKGLTELKELQGRVLELSLSTVGVTEPRPDGESDANPAAWTKANIIQKEIVKQILYRDPPQKTRGSRFRRLSRFHWHREVGVASWIASLLLAVAWLTGFTTQLAPLGESPDAAHIALAYGSLWAVLASLIYSVRWLTHNRVFLEKLSAGPATVSLAPTSSNFFDQYMDEIVYYFEQSGRDVVIFEDIDRFEDVHIFETLRALNALLNGAEQIRRGRRTDWRPLWRARRCQGLVRGTKPRREVKFVYALRDSVFEKLGNEPQPVTADEHAKSASTPRDEAEAEVQRANRTKFFDVVIPIVPFVTHRNARDLMLAAMEGTEVSRDLIRVAAQFVADMRLITDLRNEYDIYASRLLTPSTRMPGLTADRLFALVLYKCVHMADFEAIRLGTSNLDRLHDAWREIVNDSLKDAYERERRATTQLDEEGIGAARAKTLGDRLQHVTQAATQARRPISARVNLDGNPFHGEELRKPEFWRQVTGATSVALVNSTTGSSVQLSIDELETLLDHPINPTHWQQIDRRSALSDQRSAREHIAFLMHHDWQQIHARPEFRSTTLDDSAGESFADATDRILGSRLARSLVADGHLDDYFALYVSLYYGQHLRPAALNYTIHHLDRGEPDLRYALDEVDVEAIIADKGVEIFRDRAAYNISVLDHLLGTRPREAEAVIEKVAAWDARDLEFAEAYLQAGKQQVTFVQLLAPLIPKVIMSFVIDAPSGILARVIDAALDYAGAEVEGTVANQAIIENYLQFPSITTAAEAAPVDLRKHKTIDAIAKLGIQLPDTAPLKPEARSLVCELGTYQMNEANIENLTGQGSLALDAIRATKPSVYQAALARVGEYLDLVSGHDGAVTISDPAQFLPILADAEEAAVHQQHLALLIGAASPGCQVEKLTNAPTSAWSVLAASRRVAPSAPNLLAYLDHVGSIDASAATLLEPVDNIAQVDEVIEADKVRLAVAIINAGDSIRSPEHRVQLVTSLELPSTIPIGSLTPESGALPGLLIEARLLPDNEVTFTSALMVNWTTREAALIRSTHAPDFITPDSLPPQELAEFFQSDEIPQQLKAHVLAKITDFIPQAGADAARAATSFAIATRADLPFAAVDMLGRAGPSDPQIVALLVTSSSITMDEIRNQLRIMADPYPALADRGTSRPRVPDDEAHRQLLNRLQAESIVSTHEAEGDGRRVHLRRATTV